MHEQQEDEIMKNLIRVLGMAGIVGEHNMLNGRDLPDDLPDLVLDLVRIQRRQITVRDPVVRVRQLSIFSGSATLR